MCLKITSFLLHLKLTQDRYDDMSVSFVIYSISTLFLSTNIGVLFSNPKLLYQRSGTADTYPFFESLFNPHLFLTAFKSFSEKAQAF